MKCKVIDTINKNNMLKNGDTVIVGVSGGADSMSLLHLLYSIKESYHLTVVAVHINHGIRGEEANSDEKFVAEYCDKLGIEKYVFRENVIEQAKLHSMGVEEFGRKIRYQRFDEVCRIYGDEVKIATAHTMSDNIETMIFNMCRGCANNGVRGILPKRGKIIRPLIYCSREEIEKYCNDNCLNFVTDSTNLSDNYTRNFIRHQIVPKLQQINSNSLTNFSNLSKFATEDEEYFNQQIEKIVSSCKIDEFCYDCKVLKNLHISLLSRFVVMLLKTYCDNIGSQTQRNQIINSIKNGKGKTIIQNEFCFCVSQNLLTIQHLNEEFDKCEQYIIENLPSSIQTGGKRFDFTIQNVEFNECFFKIYKKLLTINYNYDTISERLIFRHRKAGDVFTLCDRNITKTVKKLFNEYKIPANKRDKLFLLESDGEIIWIENIGVSEKFKVTKDSKYAITIKISED